MALGLSAEYLDKRMGYVMASDAKPIMEGDWRRIWRLKKGFPPVANDMGLSPWMYRWLEAESGGTFNLSDVFRVQLGSYTEPFNAWRYMEQTGRPLEYFSDNVMMQMIFAELTNGLADPEEFKQSEEYPWMAYSRDGISVTSRGERACWDAKHVSQFRHDELVARYTPAMTHQCTCEGLDHWVLSVIVGNSKLEVIEQEVDWLYQAELIEKTRAFWDLVERDEEPDEVAPRVEPPKPQPRLRVVHLDDDCRENWAGEAIDLIRTFATTDEAHKLHMLTRENIKKIVPDDVGEVTRDHFRLTRSINGAVTMSIRKGGE
jgi:hypothetical protein